ncbi:VOC family protein [Pseudooceanicola nanhaiensis]|uniref:VOC family protein n=1 Tax=Pseudooceanicola nanhaiensis TaxID=375761 RepID=UPI001CD2F03E|nr:VOC family protein [Pseudooceanicola nanhaiensis]MCA0921360.1 VOC family protein [Pseudooceanicola nanhaiensis]
MTSPASLPPVTVVWAEIPVSDLDAATAFYNSVFGWEMTPMMMGPETVSAFGRGGVGGNLVEGPVPAGKGPVIHIAVADGVEAARDRAAAAGATFEGEITTIPPGRYLVMHDPDGNRIGLFEPA